MNKIFAILELELKEKHKQESKDDQEKKYRSSIDGTWTDSSACSPSFDQAILNSLPNNIGISTSTSPLGIPLHRIQQSEIVEPDDSVISFRAYGEPEDRYGEPEDRFTVADRNGNEFFSISGEGKMLIKGKEVSLTFKKKSLFRSLLISFKEFTSKILRVLFWA